MTIAAALSRWPRADIRLVRDYPHSRAKVWRALTDPALMARWGMRPEGFALVVGTRFRLVGTPNRVWRGFVECEVTRVDEARAISYTWIGNAAAAPVQVTYTLDDASRGTRLTLEYAGLSGIRGLLFAHLVMRPGLRRMLDRTFPAVLASVVR